MFGVFKGQADVSLLNLYKFIQIEISVCMLHTLYA